MGELAKETERVDPWAIPTNRLGTSIFKKVTYKYQGTDLKFLVREIGNKQFLHMSQKIGDVDVKNYSETTEDQRRRIKETMLQLVEENLLICPDGLVPDDEYLKYLVPEISSFLVDHIVPKKLVAEMGESSKK